MDYCTVQQVRARLGGMFGVDPNLGPGASGLTRDGVIAELITDCSRMFDRETAKPTNFWAPGPAVRRYSGSGDQWLNIDDFQAIASVSMSTKQDRSDAITLTLTDATSMNYVVVQPNAGPPFNQLFLLRGWLPDAYNINNVVVTGTVITPDEIQHAVATWAAYEWSARDAGWQDSAGAVNQPGRLYLRGIPPEVQRVISYYSSEHGLKLAIVAGGNDPRSSPWLGWRTTGNA